MVRSNLPAEIRTLLRRFVQGDNILVISMMEDAGLFWQNYAVDPAKSFEANIDSLIAGLLDRPADQRALAREILKRFENAKLPIQFRLEVRYGLWPIIALRSLFSLLIVSGVLLSVYIAHQWAQENQRLEPEGVLRGNLIQVLDFYYVKPVSDVPKGQLEVILLPPRRGGLRVFDICHLAVVLSPNPEPVKGELAYKILDLYIDSSVCNTPLEEFLLEGWGVSIDPTHYPATYLRRAERENEEAERSGLSQQQREKNYKIAQGYFEKAVQLYEENGEFRDQAPRAIERQIENLRGKIYYQSLLINSVTAAPLHEMVFIKGGNSWRWHEEHSQGRVEMIRLPGFWIDRFETSNYQYEEFNPGRRRPSRTVEDNFPVTLVSWEEAQRYCIQRGLRLPTEEEFEKAATWDPRKSEPRKFPWCRESCMPKDIPYGKLGPVQEDPNESSAFNVLNLVGNAAEWVIRKRTGVGIVKGGSFASDDSMEFDPRHAISVEETGRDDIGFRCAADQPPISDRILLRK